VVDLGKEHTESKLYLQVIYANLEHSLYIKIVQIPMNHGESERLFSRELLILASVSRGEINLKHETMKMKYFITCYSSCSWICEKI